MTASYQGRTLDEWLAVLGLVIVEAPRGYREVCTPDGEVVFKGRAWQVWGWLHRRIDPAFDGPAKECAVGADPDSTRCEGLRGANGVLAARLSIQLQEQ